MRYRMDKGLSRSLAVGLLGVMMSGPGLLGATEEPDVLMDELLGPVQDTSDSRKKGETVYMPIPMSNPTIGTGAALAAMTLFPMDEKSKVSDVSLAGLYTNSESWAAGALARLNMKEDRLRMKFGVGYFDMNLSFFGLGSGSSDRSGVEIPINQEGAFAIAEVLWDIGGKVYVGPSYRHMRVSSSLNLDNPFEPLEIISSGPGARISWDTRNNLMNPSEGFRANLNVDTSMKSMGGDRDYELYKASYSHYFDLQENRVLATRVTGCAASSEAPFYDVCLFGSNNALRGYVGGEYRDNRMVTVEAEYRWRFTERFGMVAFAGVGQVGSSFGDMGSGNKYLSGVGGGLRFLASTKHKVNVSVDWAKGENSDALYFYIGEAF